MSICLEEQGKCYSIFPHIRSMWEVETRIILYYSPLEVVTKLFNFNFKIQKLKIT